MSDPKESPEYSKTELGTKECKFEKCKKEFNIQKGYRLGLDPDEFCTKKCYESHYNNIPERNYK